MLSLKELLHSGQSLNLHASVAWIASHAKANQDDDVTKLVNPIIKRCVEEQLYLCQLFLIWCLLRIFKELDHICLNTLVHLKDVYLNHLCLGLDLP